MRGFNKEYVSPQLRQLLEKNFKDKAMGEAAHLADSEAQEVFKYEFTYKDLIQEDWRDFVAAFYFPRQR